MSSMHRQAGAVSILFLVFVLVIALAFGVLWFMQLQENEQLKSREATAVQEMELFRARSQFASRAYELVASVAWEKFPSTCPLPADEELLDTPADDVLKPLMDEAKRDLSGLKDEIEAPGITPQTFRGAWGDFKNKIAGIKTEVQNRDLEISRLKAEVQEKDAQIAQVNEAKASDRQKADELHSAAIDNLKNQNADLRSQNQAFSDKNRELTDEIRSTIDKAAQDVQKALLEKEALLGQVNQIKSSLRVARETEKPDGNVVRVDPTDDIVWIDVGAKKLLRLGTRFKVYETGKGGVKIPKGFIRVIRLYPDKAECRIDQHGEGEIDSGDWIYNPYYDPEKATHFVFLGELPGSWDRTTVEELLKSRGAVIDEQVTVFTDFLVMGVQEDEEEGEVLTDSPDYKRAVELGVQILRAPDLTPYLKF